MRKVRSPSVETIKPGHLVQVNGHEVVEEDIATVITEVHGQGRTLGRTKARAAETPATAPKGGVKTWGRGETFM